MENLESVEPPKEERKAKVTVPKKENKSSGKKKPTHFCKEHGPNFSHNTDECHSLRKQSGGGGKKFGNKTWTRKSNDSVTASKKELAAFIKKQVKTSVKELASVDKKRKADSDDEGECHLLEALGGKLDGFNYDEMEKLSIDDDTDEISV